MKKDAVQNEQKVQSKTLKVQEDLKAKVRNVIKNRENDETIKTADTLNFKLIDGLQSACEKSLDVTESLNSNMEKLLEIDFDDIRLCQFEEMMKSIDIINTKLDDIIKLL